MLSIVVCVKAVPDPEKAGNIKIDPVTKSLNRANIPLTMNLLDRYALEIALRSKEISGSSVTVLSMGPPEAGNIIKECLALGADKGILLTDRLFGGADAYATAVTLSKAIQKISLFDLVLCGASSSDGSTEWVGPEIAAMLDIPILAFVKEVINNTGSEWLVKSEIENGYQLVKVHLPAVLTITRQAQPPRQLNFSGILKSRTKEITEWDHSALGLTEDLIGINGSPTRVVKLASTEVKRNTKVIDGTLEEQADQLIKILESNRALQ